MYKLAVIYSPDLFLTSLNIPDSFVLDDLKRVYSGTYNVQDIEVFKSTDFVDSTDFNNRIKAFSAIQIMSHGHKGFIDLDLFNKKRYTYNELFNNTGLVFEDHIIFLNVCYSGDMVTFSQGVDVFKPSILIAYSNLLNHGKATINVLGKAHRDLSNYFAQKGRSKINREMHNELMDTMMIMDFTESHHDTEFPNIKRNSSDDPGFAFMCTERTNPI